MEIGDHGGVGQPAQSHALWEFESGQESAITPNRSTMDANVMLPMV